MTTGRTTAETGKKTIYLHCSNHFDPIWRRGFKKSFEYKGERYVGNSVIQLGCIEDWVEMSRDSSLKFEVECSLVLRTYLERHPEHLDVFRRLIREGRFELLAAGEIIPDPHMPLGETLVRNLLYGLLWAEDALGETPVTGCANDGFGSSAQMPQIFRGCGIEWLTGLSYGYPTKDYWRGLDGSMLYIRQDYRMKNAKYLGRTSYYRPCPDCRGAGCDSCLQRGFDHSYRMDGELDGSGLDMDHYPIGWIEVGGEENLVALDLDDKVERANAGGGSEYNYEFILLRQLADRYRDDIAAVDSPDPLRISPEVEGKPVSTGCFVSRIKVKQELRKLENRAEVIEKWAALAHMSGGRYPQRELTESRRGIVFAAFHDSVTGTHIDVGYDELMETFAEAEMLLSDAARLLERDHIEADGEAVSVFNPHSYEVAQPVAVALPGTAPVYRIADEQGHPVPLYEATVRDGGIALSFCAAAIPGLSWKTYRIERGSSASGAAGERSLAGAASADGSNEYPHVDDETGRLQGASASADGSDAHGAVHERDAANERNVMNEHDAANERNAVNEHGAAGALAAERGAAIENEFYKVTTNNHGIIGIFDKRTGKELIDATHGYANELVLEHDVGDPWTTRELNRPRMRLGSGSRLTGVEIHPDYSAITYRGKLAGNEDVTDPVDYRVLILEWEQRVIVRKGIPRVDFETTIDWDSFDRRIRISFPTPIRHKKDPGHYAIPYGTLTRDRYEMSFTGWENANGDWPGVEWASTAAVDGINVAIFNRGTPSYRIERGEILMSVLRSPTFPNCLLWPREYNAPVYDGMRDQGVHSFSYSLYSYEGPWQQSEVVREAYGYNKPPLAFPGRINVAAAAAAGRQSLGLDAAHTLISAIKKAERGESTIIRLFEYGGIGEDVRLRLPPHIAAVYETNLLEKRIGELVLSADRTVTVAMSPFKIRTIELCRESE